MKRNLFLLTAVVLVAVMLTGCITLPFTTVKVKFEEPKNEADKVLLKATDLAKNYKKGTSIEINFEFTEDRVDEEFEFEFVSDDKNTELTYEEVAPEGDSLGGYQVTGTVGKKDVTIKVTLVGDAE